MTDADRQRLAAILGMLGSEHAGERAAAGLQAEAFRRKHRLTWPELLALPRERGSDLRQGAAAGIPARHRARMDATTAAAGTKRLPRMQHTIHRRDGWPPLRMRSPSAPVHVALMVAPLTMPCWSGFSTKAAAAA